MTGGGQEFVRVYAMRVYGLAPKQIVGSSIATKYEVADGKPILMRLPKVFFIDDHAGKPVGINLFIGKGLMRLSAIPAAIAKCWNGRVPATACG